MNLSVFIILFSLIQIGKSFIIESAVIGGLSIIGYTFRCKVYECCDDHWIPLKSHLLWSNLQSKLYGQHIARNLVFSAISSHVHHNNPRKPLVLSFHGLPGTGKNYVTSMIAQALFKLGEKSNHYYFFNGRNDFPLEEMTNLYKHNLREKIDSALKRCGRSLFVFDEVDKMPVGVLDVLVPFIDYTSYKGTDKNKSIFIFLSNTGSDQIVQRMLKLWQEGQKREDTTIRDFESLIAIGAFNEKGGLHKSGTIESKLIDHHIPFLPMEMTHVVQCIEDAFIYWAGRHPTKDEIRETLKHVTFGPPPHNLYSTSGCKRLEYKVASIIKQDEFQL